MLVSLNETPMLPVAAPVNDGPPRSSDLIHSGAGASVVVVVVVEVVGDEGVDIQATTPVGE